VVIPLTLVTYILLAVATGGNPEGNPGLSFFVTLILGAIALLSAASIAVNWHRYILRDEVPRGANLLRLDDVVWRYFGNLLLIMLAVFAIVVVAAIPLNLIGALAGSPGFGVVLTFIVALPIAGTLFLRLGVRLPSIALGRTDFFMRDAWNITKENNGAILVLFLLNALVGLSAIAAVVAVAAVFSLLGAVIAAAAEIIVQVAANWLLTIFGITILTSLYGFFVESRDF
jgi:hypothetical protein